MLDAPDEVAPEQEFLIQVSLTEQQLTPDVQILNGEANDKVAFSLPRTPITRGRSRLFSWRPAWNLLAEQRR